MKVEIQNPILTGFNPDPSIIRVNDDYYIATSTFEWFPGVQIYHSKDLKNWELTARPLNRQSQLNLKGIPDSCGVWAPCLTYDRGMFYLVYTVVFTTRGIWRDMFNYLVMSESIDGDWSEPIYLNGTGHDPSLFHDEDRKWLLNAQWEYIEGKNVFSGIVLQEYAETEKKLIGQPQLIFKGTEHGLTEGPHMNKKDDYYYLLTAEGGTWYDHCVSIARSKNIEGPYEVHPNNPILTSKGKDNLGLQKAGHADLVETPEGWFMVHLCGRPFGAERRCTLGRETAIQRLRWDKDEWPRLESGDNSPAMIIKGLEQADIESNRNLGRDHFDASRIDINYQALRTPINREKYDLTARRSFLRMYGRQSLSSVHDQSLIARRLQAYEYRVQTAVVFDPKSSRDTAGLIIYYNTENYFYLCLSKNEVLGRCLRVISCNKGKTAEPTGQGIPIGNQANILHLRLISYGNTAQFSFAFDEQNWMDAGDAVEIDRLSDEFIGGKAFTGTFAGICCQAVGGDEIFADFDYFEYIELSSEGNKE